VTAVPEKAIQYTTKQNIQSVQFVCSNRDRRGRDRMVVGFI